MSVLLAMSENGYFLGSPPLRKVTMAAKRERVATRALSHLRSNPANRWRTDGEAAKRDSSANAASGALKHAKTGPRGSA